MRKNGNLMNNTIGLIDNEKTNDLSTLIIRDFTHLESSKSLLDYQETHQRMLQFTENRLETTQDEIWFLEHDRVFTQGQAGKAEHVLFPGDIPVVQSDRGGQVTYHGPGQLVVYVMIDIKRKNLGPRQLVTAIEDAIVLTLKDFQINSAPKKDAPGVYVEHASAFDENTTNMKIASLGLRIKQGRSFHGLALNIDMDMEPFHRINPCGYKGMEMTQVLTELKKQKTLNDAKAPELFKQISTRLKHHLTQTLQYTNAIEF